MTQTVVFKYSFNGKVYNVEIIYKRIKNSYIRVKENDTILVTANYLLNKQHIIELIEKNMDSVDKMFSKLEKNNKSNYYLGKKYNVIYTNTGFLVIDDTIYVKDLKELNKWYLCEINRIYKERLDYIYNMFEEKIPYPKLKVRKMKTRWGVCNKRDNSVTLNYNLIYYDIKDLDYVITHELAHFVYFDHSKNFWKVVGKYYPNYKQARKELRD